MVVDIGGSSGGGCVDDRCGGGEGRHVVDTSGGGQSSMG